MWGGQCPPFQMQFVDEWRAVPTLLGLFHTLTYKILHLPRPWFCRIKYNILKYPSFSRLSSAYLGQGKNHVMIVPAGFRLSPG
jgi:hypothetical protein